MASLRFSKYQGIGNDFVIIHGPDLDHPLTSEAVRFLCDRRHGIGADGVLTVWPVQEGAGRMQVQNADGSDTEMCGNGLRCVAAYLRDQNQIDVRNPFVLYSDRGPHLCHFQDDDVVIDMGKAELVHRDLPVGENGIVQLDVDGLTFSAVAISMGNPHAIIFTESDPMRLGLHYGAALEIHSAFPNRVNVSFVRAENQGFTVFVHERGVGPTLACGSAACAVVAAAIITNRAQFNQAYRVTLPGGDLAITCDDDLAVRMCGPAVHVFNGTITT